MMYITHAKNKSAYVTWHLGEPIPPVMSNYRVITLQVDCDELEMITAAMSRTTLRTVKEDYNRGYEKGYEDGRLSNLETPSELPQEQDAVSAAREKMLTAFEPLEVANARHLREYQETRQTLAEDDRNTASYIRGVNRGLGPLEGNDGR